MERAVLRHCLEQAERQIAIGEKEIVRLRQIVAGLEWRGLDARDAREDLALLVDAQALHIATRNHLRDALKVRSA